MFVILHHCDIWIMSIISAVLYNTLHFYKFYNSIVKLVAACGHAILCITSIEVKTCYFCI